MAHDFKNFPELANSQMQIYYHESPHKQLTTGFLAQVTKVIDGDTIRVSMDERDFDFPVRFLNTDAPERNTAGFQEAKNWLTDLIQDKEVYVLINPHLRVGKWGRLLGEVIFEGINLNEQSLREKFAEVF